MCSLSYDTEYAVASAKLELISVVSGMEHVMGGPLWEMLLPFLSHLKC